MACYTIGVQCLLNGFWQVQVVQDAVQAFLVIELVVACVRCCRARGSFHGRTVRSEAIPGCLWSSRSAASVEVSLLHAFFVFAGREPGLSQLPKNPLCSACSRAGNDDSGNRLSLPDRQCRQCRAA